jgi:hypothetical protein
MTWAVWRELRRRPHLDLVFADIDGADGLLVDIGGGRREVIVDRRLGRRRRRAVLAHELVHDERGLLFDADTPVGIVRKEEAIVDAITAARLVPLDDLQAFVNARCDAEGITAHHVADEFDVPNEVAERAMRLLQQRHLSPHHPAMRRFTL